MVVVGVADDSTRHIQEYNFKSKSKKRPPPVKRPARRPLQMSTHWKPPPQQQQQQQQQQRGQFSGGGRAPPGSTPPRPYSRSGAPGGYRGPARPVFNGRGGPIGPDRVGGGGARYGNIMSQGPLREPKGGYGSRSAGGPRSLGGQGSKHFPPGGGVGSGSSRPGQVKSPPRGQQQQQQQAARYFPTTTATHLVNRWLYLFNENFP